MIIGTLGPRRTNSELAAKEYLERNESEGSVELYDTPEKSIDALLNKEIDKAVLCVVYPKLNEIVFNNLSRISLSETFTFPTMPMVVARASEGNRACSHPAPVSILPNSYEIEFVNSNAVAAQLCREGKYDLCVTTLSAAKHCELEVIKNSGAVDMGWAVFTRKNDL